jgi:ATP-dependent Clp protease ATP-binding subunit ClpX
MPSTFPLRPRDIYDELRKSVVGQDEAIREISVALVKHLVGQPAPNMLLIGNSGSGKTTLMRAVEQFLVQTPDLGGYANVVRLNANVLAEERQGYGKVVLGRLYENARKVLGVNAPAEEIIRSVQRGIVAQEALLTLMENENVEFEADGRTFVVNSAQTLFVAGGAFEDLYDSVLRRATIGQDVAPMKPIVVVSSSGEVREELPFYLGDYLKYDDLFRYGMTPQFISRFESIVVLNDLGEAELARIFVEPEGSIFRTSREYFARFGIDLQITRGALVAIAWDAARQKRLGARALRESYRRIIRSLEFEPRDGGTLTVDEEMVRRAIAAREQGSGGKR